MFRAHSTLTLFLLLFYSPLRLASILNEASRGSSDILAGPLRLAVLMSVLALLLTSRGVVAAGSFSNGQDAALVVGQADFTSDGYGTTQSTLDSPGGIAFDHSGNLWVADAANGRVLEYATPFSNGEAASIVLGEPDYTTSSICLGDVFVNASCLDTPADLAFDSSGNLWVADSGNNRIVEFSAPFSNYEAASLVIGQQNLTTGNNPDATPSQSDLDNPGGLAFDHSGDMWVADSGYNRVLEFAAPLSTGEAASVVIGQSNFTAGTWVNVPGCPPDCGGATSTSLNGPEGVAVDGSGNLWVADTHSDRVLEYTSPFATGEAASQVIGHADFNTGSGFCTSQNCFNTPFGVTFDSSGTMWVADTVNYRVVSVDAPFSNNESEGVVLGEPDFQTSGSVSGQVNATASDMDGPQGVAVDTSGNVWVSDTGSNRILEFVPGSSSSTTTSTSAGPSTTSTSSVGLSSATTSVTTSSTSGQTQNTSTGSGGGIPEFPFQPLAVVVFTVGILCAYALARRIAKPR
jgi:sugar lactone lactonase YvrE